MRMRISRHGAIMGLLLGTLAGGATAGEVTLDKVPAPVMDAVKAWFADAKVTGAGKEKTPEGQEVYEISLENKSYPNIDVTVTTEGAILLIEKQITRKNLPEPVLTSLEGKYAKAKYKIVEEIIDVVESTEVAGKKEEKLRAYEVLLMTPEKQLWSVELGLDGKILKEEKKPLEEEDD